MKCTNCGYEFNNANFCPNCGEKVILQQSYQAANNNQKVIKKKDSPLSIVAIILAFFGITSPIGFIIAIIDLGINDKNYRHLGSWFSFVFCLIYLFIIFI